MPDEQRIGIVIEGQDRLSPELRKVAQGFRMTEQEYRKFLASLKPEKMKEMSAATGMSTEKLKQWASGIKAAGAATEQTTQRADLLRKAVIGVGGALVAHLGAQRLNSIAQGFVTANVQLSLHEARLRGILGPGRAASKSMDELLQVMRETSTISLEQLVSARILLESLGLGGANAARNLKVLSAAAETLPNRSIDQLARSLARVNAQLQVGKAPDVRMMQQLGVTVKELNDLAKGAPISLNTVIQAMGKFGTTVAETKRSAAGALDDVGDEFLILQQRVGKAMEPATLAVLRFKATLLESIGKQSPAMLATIGYGTAIGGVVASVAQFVIPIATIKSIRDLTAATKGATAAVGVAGATGAAGGLLGALTVLKTIGRISIPITLAIIGAEAFWTLDRRIRELSEKGVPAGEPGTPTMRFGRTVTGFEERLPRRMTPAQERADINRLLGVTTKGVHPEGAIQRLSRAWAAEFAKDYSGRIQAFLNALGPGRGFRATSVVRPWGGHARWKKVDVVPTGKTSWAELTAAAEAADFHVSREVKASERSARATGAHLDLALLTPEARAALSWQAGMAKETQTAADKARKEGEKRADEAKKKAEEVQAARIALYDRQAAAAIELKALAGRAYEAEKATLEHEFNVARRVGGELYGMPVAQARAILQGRRRQLVEAQQKELEEKDREFFEKELADLERQMMRPSVAEPWMPGQALPEFPGGIVPQRYRAARTITFVPGMSREQKAELEFRGQREGWTPKQRELAQLDEELRRAELAGDEKQTNLLRERILVVEAGIDVDRRGVEALRQYSQEVERFTDRLVNLLLDPSGKGFADFFGSLAKTMQAGWLEQAISPYVGRFVPTAGGGGTKAITDVLGALPKVGPPSDPKSQAKAVKEGVQAAGVAAGGGIAGRTLSRGTATTFAAIGVAASMTGSDVVQSAVGMGMAGFQVAGWPGAIAGLALGAILGSRAKKKANEQAKARQWLNAPEEFEIQAYLYNLGRMGNARGGTWAGWRQRDPLVRVDTVNINVNGSGDPTATARAVTAELQALTMSAGAYGGEYD